MNTTLKQSRKAIMAALILSGFLIGIVAGAFVAGNFLVDKSAGLAGGVMVLFYALLFALVLSIAGGIAGKLLPRHKARLLAWLTAPIGLVILLFLSWRISVERTDNRAVLEAGYASLLPYEVHVTNLAKIESFSYVYADNLVRAQIRNRNCSGPLPGSSRLALLTALRGIEGRTINCSDCDETSTKVNWQIHEAMGTVSSSEFGVSERVLADFPEVASLLDTVTEASREIPCE